MNVHFRTEVFKLYGAGCLKTFGKKHWYAKDNWPMTFQHWCCCQCGLCSEDYQLQKTRDARWQPFTEGHASEVCTFDTIHLLIELPEAEVVAPSQPLPAERSLSHEISEFKQPWGCDHPELFGNPDSTIDIEYQHKNKIPARRTGAKQGPEICSAFWMLGHSTSNRKYENHEATHSW